jgi:hypothetical protein
MGRQAAAGTASTEPWGAAALTDQVTCLVSLAAPAPGQGRPNRVAFARKRPRNGRSRALGRLRMKVYEGKREFDGLVVTVDGKPLPEHYEVSRFTTWGFEWTYEGESPQQLALAILYDHLGDKTRAIGLSERFMRKVVANLDNDWRLTSEDVDKAVAEIDRE